MIARGSGTRLRATFGVRMRGTRGARDATSPSRQVSRAQRTRARAGHRDPRFIGIAYGGEVTRYMVERTTSFERR